MNFVSTRGKAPVLNFEEVILTGLAADGGLYVPETLPQFSTEEIASWADLTYEALAFKVMWPFVEGEMSAEEFQGIINTAYASFRHSAVAPLVQTARNEWILELFHGPTLAFKDFALQFLGQLLDNVLTKRQQRAIVLGATSGDTGSAAIEGCRHCKNVDIFILHPHQRVSDVQRKQMTTVLDPNVHNLALKGNFDDCQNAVKASFRDQSFLPQGHRLVAVNSINWARIMAQIVYYFYSALALGAPHRKISYSVPTGNFGDIFAGYLAKRMGLPIDKLVVATNANDILHRCITQNDHSKKSLHHSLSPSMDIMVSSNFERLLFDVYQRDGAAIAKLMDDFSSGTMTLTEPAFQTLRAEFSSHRLDDNEMLALLADVYDKTEYILDPHTAIGLAAARKINQDSVSVCSTKTSSDNAQSMPSPMVCLATAHPAKFPEAIQKAGLDHASLPHHLADLFDRQERYKVIDNTLQNIQNFIQEQVRG